MLTPPLTQFAVTGRKIVVEDYVGFTANTFLGHVHAANEAEAEKKAQAHWPGWDDYTVWPPWLN